MSERNLPLSAILAQVPDPRKSRGRQYSWFALHLPAQGESGLDASRGRFRVPRRDDHGHRARLRDARVIADRMCHQKSTTSDLVVMTQHARLQPRRVRRLVLPDVPGRRRWPRLLLCEPCCPGDAQ